MVDNKQQIDINGCQILLDQEGYLIDPKDWTTAIAEALAEQEGRILDERHWAIITLVREFYERYEMAPAMRPLVKLVRQTLGEEQGQSIYLMKLFPESPARVVARLAGLPKPTNCL
ncbi:TusE/DsrC/DsvC family sulfur relay protein [Kushneria phosphatilytica]|uniref:Sulfurtransferase n=1 Tax=Kushneria phosphatilytica TaxID=657387 RepID=A0A1S1P0A2_9GAMM|nr:TusE/DsrC/DsvC family sulfur relay protein [Kushneria phosphatilytica]OHV11905.1 sulfurtransferase TusE [Kushneria phosphatilytica]QEL11080.1 TusE/DsrC/DsvC family sulfur relay protein [Kushneria phosphatilytica]